MLSLAVWIQYKSVVFVTVNLLIEHFEMSVYYYIIIKSVMDRQTDRHHLMALWLVLCSRTENTNIMQ